MGNWLSTELVLGTLLATSFTSVGLVALWAATSPRHWFLRTGAVLAILAPLLFVPAYEPFLVLALEACVVVAGVRVWRRRKTARAKSGPLADSGATLSQRRAIRFSLPTLLWLTTLTAIGVVIVARIVNGMPPQNLESRTTMLLQGALGACVVLMAAWTVRSKRKRLAVSVTLTAGAAIALLIAWQDWFVVSLLLDYVSWPPDSSYWQSGWFNDTGEIWVRSAAVWLGTVSAILTVTGGVLLLWASATAPIAAATVSEAPRGTGRRLVKFCIVFVLLLLMACPAYFLVRVLNPTPFPQVTLPDPNGYDDLAAAGEMINSGSPILNTSVEPQSTDELAAEIAKFSSTYDRIRLGLSRPCQATDFAHAANSVESWQTLPLPEIQSLRAAARALMREAELAQQQGRFRDAADISIENMRLGHATARGGLLVDYLVGIAIEGIGQSTLYPAITNLDADSCRDLTAAIEQVDQSREPLADVSARDRIWSEHACGWYSHFGVVLQDLTTGSSDWDQHIGDWSLPRMQAANRLIVVELGLRRYQLAHASPPESLEQLVPEFLDRIPIDPFDPQGRPLRYARNFDGYLLYSVGGDRDDNGGQPPEKDEFGDYNWFGAGDVTLEAYFAEEVDETQSADSDANEGEALADKPPADTAAE